MNVFKRRQLIKLLIANTANQAISPLVQALASPKDLLDTCHKNLLQPLWGELEAKRPVEDNHLKQTLWGDLRRKPIIKLPKDFSYRVISIAGHTMSDGQTVPALHDGMACFKCDQSEPGKSSYRLVRNHEISPNGTLAIITDPKKGYEKRVHAGGTTTVVLNDQGQLIKDFVSLSGTIRNCSGGPSPWGTWLSCEETTASPSIFSSINKKHGYCFEVDPNRNDMTPAIALKALGRFNREAIAIDPDTGFIYQTEDRSDGCLYRFEPTSEKPKKFGDLAKTEGNLYALAIKPGQQTKCGSQIVLSHQHKNGRISVDTRERSRFLLGESLQLEWVKLKDVDPKKDTLRYEAQNLGATFFSRGEGIWYSEGQIYFCCTTGGDARKGQIWSYSTNKKTITLIAEATSENALDMPDAITMGPNNILYLCEDSFGGFNNKQQVVGLTPDGILFPFIETMPSFTSEFAGGCFSPDSRFFFVNLQGGGMTFCIWRNSSKGFTVS